MGNITDLRKLWDDFTLGISRLTELESKIVVKIVVIPRETRAGTACRDIQKQHHDRITKITAGVNTEKIKNSRRRLNENVTFRLANDAVGKNTKYC